MQNLFTISLPFFALIFGGYAAGRFNILSPPAAAGLNSFVFWFALPSMLFMRMAAAPLLESFDWRFVIAYSGGGLISFALAVIAGRILFASGLAVSAMQGMGAAFGNVGYLGLPIVIAVFGDRGVLPAVVIIVLDHVVLLPLVTMMIESDTRKHASILAILGHVLAGLARNPLIVATAAGLAWGLTHWTLPGPVAVIGNLLGNAAAPCALFALGATLAGRDVAGDTTRQAGEIALMAGCKLVVHPLSVWLLATWLLHLDPLLTAIGVIQASLPIATNVFIMARAYDVYVQRVSAAILVSTSIAVVTVSLVLALVAG